MENKFKEDTLVSMNCKVMGAAMPPQLAFYVSLFGFENGVTNSAVLRMALRDWYKNQIKTAPKSILILNIIKNFQTRWEVIKSKTVKDNREEFEKFRNTCRNELEKRGVESRNIGLIVKKIIF